MKSVSPAKQNFWSLVRLELTHNLLSSPSFGAVIFFCLFWVGTNILPVFMSALRVNYIEYSPFSPLGPLWMFVVGAMFADAHIPSLLTQRNLFHPANFLWTRAIDRRILFRARSLAITVLLLAPLMISLLLALRWPEMTMGTRGGDSASFAGKVQSAFENSSAQGSQIVLPSGNVAFSLWHLCLAMLGMWILHGIFLVVTPLMKRMNPTVGGVFLVVILLGISFFLSFLFYKGESNPLYRNLFLSFVEHWWMWIIGTVALIIPIQRLSERRYAQQELL